jgi:hypothetical protein
MKLPFIVPIPLLQVGKWVYDRYRAKRAARRYTGRWDAFDFFGRNLVPMEGALITTTHANSVWDKVPWTLHVTAKDRNGRIHRGFLVIDSLCPSRARRVILYDDSDERSVQDLEISEGTIYVSPREAGYNKHALRRCPGLLGLA